MISPVLCPRCSQADALQKVSDLYAGLVACPEPRRFAPPPPPDVNVEIPVVRQARNIAVGLMVACLFALAFAGSDTLIVPSLIVILGSFGVVIYLMRGYPPVTQKRAQLVAQYERRIAVWRELVYCTRDEVVFDPESGRCLPLDRLLELTV